MPITEAPYVDGRTFYVQVLFDLAMEEDGSRVYEELHARRQAEAARRAARSAQMSEIAKRKRRKQPGSRPWQRGFTTKQAWLDAQKEKT